MQCPHGSPRAQGVAEHPPLEEVTGQSRELSNTPTLSGLPGCPGARDVITVTSTLSWSDRRDAALSPLVLRYIPSYYIIQPTVAPSVTARFPNYGP